MQTITMNQGKATLPPVVTPEPSLAEQATRLELFEIAQLRYRIEALQHEIAGWKGRLHAAESANSGELEQKVADLEAQLAGEADKYKDLKKKFVTNARKIEEQEAFIKELKSAGDALGDERDQLQEFCRKQAINRTTAERKLADAQTCNAALEKQLKELKKLDPERLQKQVKKLQKDNKEKQESIEELRKQNHRFLKDNTAKAKQVEQLDKALDRACKDINNANSVEPLEEHNLGALGRWKIYGSPETNKYDVLDVTNNVSYGVEVKDGQVIQPKVRNMPKNLQKTLIARCARYALQEKAIAETQKPLNV